MSSIKKIKIEDYAYELPDEKIAKFPLENRGNSKLLVYKSGNIQEDAFKNINAHLTKENLLVFNNTKVIQARMMFRKPTGAKIEIFCLEPIKPTDFALIFQQTKSCSWKCIVGNLKKWKEDTLEKAFTHNGEEYTLTAKKVASETNAQIIEFSWNNKSLTFSDILEINGVIPIPPYLNRETQEDDKERYQTVYSKHDGSVAAPTAGLHFTDNILDNLRANGVQTEELTLHVGAGTFKPVQTEHIGDHEMHTERIFVNINSIKNIIDNLNGIVAVGTTSVRTLESLYWLGVKVLTKKINSPEKLFISQWDAYELDQTIAPLTALNGLVKFMQEHDIENINGATQIIIAPGYEFKIIKALITNYHQPKSTLLLLISAFIGEDWKTIYDYALNNDFRFLSYGDSSLLFKY